MLFSTPIYIFFFVPAAAAGYFLLNRWNKCAYAKLWLIGASFLFYSYSAYQFLPILLCSIGVNFFLGTQLTRKHAQIKRRAYLTTGIFLNLALLGYFKYANFFLHNLSEITGADYTLWKLGLPLAISFYTFQQIAFLADCFHKQVREHDFLNYCFFITFFPKLIAGPIVRYQEMVPQLSCLSGRILNWSNIATGMFIFGIGLFKKVIIADSFSHWADAGFNAQKMLSFFEAWGASLSYTFQLYFDFSGYTDMAIGVALVLNIRLPINFNSPYKSLNIRDFWQRWHISLSRWLRDYLYIPLGGNRKGTYRTLFNLIITFLLGGLWHGAGWTFVVWGGLHGAALALHRVWRMTGLRLPSLFAWLCTFLFINFTWVFFRAESLSDAYRVLKGMFSYNLRTPLLMTNITNISFSSEMAKLWAIDGPLLTTAHAFLFIAGVPLLVFLMPNSMQLIQFEKYEGPFVFKTNFKTALLLALLLFLSFLTFVGNVSTSNFLYFNF